MTREITLEDIKEYCKPRCLTIISNELLHELTSNRTRRMFQQISNDAVSRQEVKRIAKEMYLEVANMNLDVNSISDCISYTSSKCRQVFEDKLQALPSVTPKQQPCDDAISRKAVLKIIRDWWKRTIMADGEPTVLCDSIRALPLVKPKQKTGHWFVDERPESDREIICSNCEQPIFKYHKMDFDYRPKYCPNCGAKMGSEE